MDALREVVKIRLVSKVANYKKEETIDNKMTYPLPPFSTIIGALHKACGYDSYHEMDISIQGNFESLEKKAFRSSMFLDGVQNDRDTLVKMKSNSVFSNSFDKIITSKVSQGADIKNNIKTKVLDQKLYDEYLGILEIEEVFNSEENDIYKPRLKEIKDKVKVLKDSLKSLSSEDNSEVDEVNRSIEALKSEEKSIKEERASFKEENITYPKSLYRTFNTSLKSYELLYNVDLIIHVSSDEDTLRDIEANIYNLTAIGRSEDFVEVKEIKRVKLTRDFDDCNSKNSHYLDFSEISNNEEDKGIELVQTKGISRNGTVYYLNKDYKIVDNKRIFNKKKVLYCSEFNVSTEDNENIFVDDDMDIVSLL